MLADIKREMMESMKEVALQHQINRLQPIHAQDPKPGTSGLSNNKRYDPLSDDESDAESELGQYGSDVDYE